MSAASAAARVLSLSQRAGLGLPPVASEVLSFWFGEQPAWPASGQPKTSDEEEVQAAWTEGIQPANGKRWFSGDKEVDEQTRERFGATLDQLHDAIQSGAEPTTAEWVRAENPRAGIAAVLLADQFPRNAFRGTAKCFAFDAHARDLAKAVLQRDDLGDVRILERSFLLFPLEHSEELADHEQLATEMQRLSDACDEQHNPKALRELIDGLAKYAKDHTAVVRRFGRYPHRNKVLGRESTPEEVEYLKDAETWGQ